MRYLAVPPRRQRQVKTGEIPQEKTPYMQRGGGAWDDSDLAKKNLKSKEGKTIAKKKWSETDKAYARVRHCCCDRGRVMTR